MRSPSTSADRRSKDAAVLSIVEAELKFRGDPIDLLDVLPYAGFIAVHARSLFACADHAQSVTSASPG
jgi:hypothetical protein